MALDDLAGPYLIEFVEVRSSGGRIGITPCPGTGWVPSARLADLRREAEARGMPWRHAPIADGGVPDSAFEARWRDVGESVRGLLREGRSVLLSCLGGLGCSGTVAACLLVELGEDPRVTSTLAVAA